MGILPASGSGERALRHRNHYRLPSHKAGAASATTKASAKAAPASLSLR